MSKHGAKVAALFLNTLLLNGMIRLRGICPLIGKQLAPNRSLEVAASGPSQAEATCKLPTNRDTDSNLQSRMRSYGFANSVSFLNTCLANPSSVSVILCYCTDDSSKLEYCPPPDKSSSQTI